VGRQRAGLFDVKISQGSIVTALERVREGGQSVDDPPVLAKTQAPGLSLGREIQVRKKFLAPQQLRNLVAHHVLGFPAARHAMAERLSETFFGYPKSPLNSGSAAGLNGPAPGDRIVDEKPFGSGNAPRFALMATDESAAKIMTEKYPSLVEASLRTSPDEKGIWLVRPDGYVAAVAHDGDWKTIEAALSRIAL
jgi:hypothetical protein